jgi:hypothetical protein
LSYGLAVPGFQFHSFYGLRELLRFFQIVALSASLALFGCTAPARELTTYRATVERIVERNGDFYSPVRGHKPLYCLYLRLNGSDESDRKELLRVLVLDLYVREIYGKKGDAVEFRYLGNLRRAAEVNFDSLFEYRVVEKGG